MKQSKELTAFYNAYNDWLEAGAPEENEYNFHRHGGLCYNIIYIGAIAYGTKKLVGELIPELKEQFEKAHLDKDYPFGRWIYLVARYNDTQHLDPNRIRWVKSHLTEEVEEKFELI